MFVLLPVNHTLGTYCEHCLCLPSGSTSQRSLHLRVAASLRGKNRLGSQQSCVLALALIHLFHSLLTLYTMKDSQVEALSASWTAVRESLRGLCWQEPGWLCTNYLSKTSCGKSFWRHDRTVGEEVSTCYFLLLYCHCQGSSCFHMCLTDGVPGGLLSRLSRLG